MLVSTSAKMVLAILEKAPLIEGPLAGDAKRRDRGDRDRANSPLTVLNLSNSRPFYANLGIFRIL